MSKKKFNKDVTFGLPEIITTDEIGYMTEDALRDRNNRLEMERNQLVASGKNSYLWEVELAYIQREQNIRRVRSEFHAEYVKKFGQNKNFEEVLDSSHHDEVGELN